MQSTLTIQQTTSQSSRHALMALLLVVPAASIGAAAGLWWWPGTVLGHVIFGVCKVWLLMGPLVWLWLIDRGKPAISRPTRSGLIFGMVVGTTIGMLIVMAYLLVRKHWFKHDEIVAKLHKNHLDVWWVYLSFVVFESGINSLLEEYVWRWFVFRKCELLIGGPGAIVLSALLFTVHHVVGMSATFNWKVTALASVGVFLGGMIWSAIYLRFRSIWPGYISHMLVDGAIFAVGARIIFGN